MARFGGSTSRIVLLALVATVLGVGVWVASGAAIDASRLKGELQRAVKRATGRELTIDGPLRIAMGTAPRITVEGISLANVPGGSAPAMLTAKTLEAQVALLPLLGGQLVLEDVTLQGADLLVETGPDGKPNWQFQAQRHALYDAGEAAPAAHGGGGELDLHHIAVKDSRVTWRPSADRSVVVDVGDATLRTDGADSAMHVQVDGSAYGVPYALMVTTGSFERLQGGPVTALATTWALNVVLSAADDARLTLDGGVTHPEEWRGYIFRLNGNARDLAPLKSWLPASLALPLRDVNLTARLSDGSNGVFHTSSVSLHAGGADLGSAVPGLVLKEAVFSAPGPGQQAELSVDGLYQGAPLRLAGTATQPDVLTGNVPVPVTFSAEAGTASLSARGTVPASLSSNGFDLNVDVRAPSLGDLSGLAGRPLPDVHNIALSAHLGDAGFRLRGLNLRDFSFDSSLGDLAGAVTLAWAPVPTLSGSLTSKRFDLDEAVAAWRLLAPPAAPAVAPVPSPGAVPVAPAAAPPTLIPDTPLPFTALHAADGDLTLALDSMIAGGETYRDVQAKLVASGGRVVVNPLRLTAPQGVVIGGLTVDASADPAHVALSFRAPGMAAAKLSNLLGYPGGVSGQVQVDAQVSAAGNSPHALAADLDGHVGLTLVNGSVSDELLQTMLGSALSKAGVPSFGGDVAVRCFAGRADFSQGHGQVRALALDTPQMALDGDGTLDLAAETLSLHLRPVVRVGGTGVAAPVSLSGGFGDLNAALDPVLGGRVGITIGGPAPSAEACVSKLALARGGMAGPMPAVAREQPQGKGKKPIDLLRGLFH
jgi:AsmA protein